MDMKMHPIHGGKLSEADVLIFPEIEAEFQAKLSGQKSGADLVQEIYDCIDEINRDYYNSHSLACHRGCGFCCRQLICCTALEMELIVKFIRSRPRAIGRVLMKQMKKEALWLNRQMISASGKFAISCGQQLQFFARIYQGRVCPFLSQEQVCLIYPARPIDCRIAKADHPCSEGVSKKDSLGIRLIADQVASNLIMDEDKRINRKMQLSPLANWAASPKFYRTFLG